MKRGNYEIEYSITKTLDGHGEFSYDQIVEKHSFSSVTNDLNEVFTDLFDKHRFDSIVGLEVLKVTAPIEFMEEKFDYGFLTKNIPI
jgi:hypothetical protein